MKTIVLVAILAAAGCSKKSRAANPQMQNSLNEMVAKMRTTLTQRCKDDGWSAEAVDCYGKLTTQAEMRGCEQKLTDEQRTKLRTEIRQAMSSMRMTLGGPGHPPMLGSGGPPAAPGATPPAGADTPPATPPPAATTPPPAPPNPPATPPAPPAPSGAAPAAGSSASGW